MNEKISRLDLLRAGAVGVGGITLLGALSGAGCAKEKLVGAEGPPKTDPKLLQYREESKFVPGFHWVRGLCCAGDSIWVAGDMAVGEFSLDGKLKQSHDLGAAAKCVARTKSGRLYAAADDHVVEVGRSKWASLGPRARLVSIVADDDAVFVADAGNRQIVHYDPSGKIVGQFGAKTAGYDGLVVPSAFIGMSQHPSGDLLITNIGRHRVERHTRDGKLIEAVGEAGMEMDAFCGCCNPTHVSALENGDMVTSEKGLPRVKVLRADGSLRCVVAGPEQFHAETVGLASAVLGKRILILDPWEGAVRVFAPA